MDYMPLKDMYYKLGYAKKQFYENECIQRYNSISTVRFKMKINENNSFLVITSELLNKIVKIYELNNKLNYLISRLSSLALGQYVKSCIIDEIFSTNEIEGVVSTRKDISEILSQIENNKIKSKTNSRLLGLVHKYYMLSDKNDIPLHNCQDIRNIYDDLLNEEILADNPQNLPDGVYFRKSDVFIYSSVGKIIHHGVSPEDKINEYMTDAINILFDEKLNILIKIAIFHYYFGYIHPFYDGNGRVSRFISSYLLSKNFNVLSGFRLAYTIKENISAYYKSFDETNNKINHGDLTPFVINFLDIVVMLFESLCESLSEKQRIINYYSEIGNKISKTDLENRIIYNLFVITLFGDTDYSALDISYMSKTSLNSVKKVLKRLKDMGLLIVNKIGRKYMYKFDINAVNDKIICEENISG